MFDSEETAGIGRELAAFLSGLRGLAELDEDTIIAGIAAADRLVSWANAGQLALIGELTRRRRDPEFVEDEIAAELRLSRPAAAHRLALALDLHRLPAVAAGLAAGRLDLPRAKAITEALHVLDPATAADVAGHAVDHAAAHTVGQHRAWLRGSVLAADPAAAQARHEQAVAERRVTLTPQPDGMAELWALLPAADGARAYTAIDTCARDATTPDDQRSADARRADALVDLLTGQRTAPASTVHVTVPLATVIAARTATASTAAASTAAASTAAARTAAASTAAARTAAASTAAASTAAARTAAARTAAARTAAASTAAARTAAASTAAARTAAASTAAARAATARTAAAGTTCAAGTGIAGEQPGHIPGIGPIPAAMARQLAAEGIWRWLATNPDGTILQAGRRNYRPSPALAALIRGRDQTCRFPGCRQPAHRCDLDHTIPYPTGRTIPDNLAALCRHHHRLKHNADWTVDQHPDGQLTWTSPTGRTYTTHPAHAA